MRWLVAHPGPQFSVADVEAGWIEALRDLGEDVYEFNLDDRLALYDSVLLEQGEGLFRKALTADQAIQLAMNGLAAGLFKIHPHILFVVSGFFTDTDMLDQARRYGTRVVLMMTEEPYEFSRQINLAQHADLCLLNDPTNIDQYRAVTAAEYMPHAYRPRLHVPGPVVPDMVCDLAFVGTGYPSRVDFLERMNLDGLDVILGGNWQRLTDDSPLRKYVGHDIDDCIDNADVVPLYRSASASLNLYRREAEAEHLTSGWAMGPREVELAATGCFFLRDPRPEGDELFPMLPTFAGPEDAGEQLRWWLQHDGHRREAAVRAREAITDRTFRNHAAKLLRLLDRQPVTV